MKGDKIMKEQIEFFDTDFLGNKIEIGDKVIFETPKYRDFAIGVVISKAPKTCQVEYLSFNTKSNVTVRQYYEQLIKYSTTKRGKWIPKEIMIKSITAHNYICSECESEGEYTPYYAYCGAKMTED
jgi:hypothetical protein